MNFQSKKYHDIEVSYLTELAGGGENFGQDIISYVQSEIGSVERVFEWCSGPGFMGFSLLASGLCQSLCLADINPVAIETCKRTVIQNRLSDRVSVYLSDGLGNIPGSEHWDLVVGNPPHSGTDRDFPDWGLPIKYKDVNWQIHRDFFSSVGKFLNPKGEIILMENIFCSSHEIFRNMVEESGFKLRPAKPIGLDKYPLIYYLRAYRNV